MRAHRYAGYTSRLYRVKGPQSLDGPADGRWAAELAMDGPKMRADTNTGYRVTRRLQEVLPGNPPWIRVPVEAGWAPTLRARMEGL